MRRLDQSVNQLERYIHETKINESMYVHSQQQRTIIKRKEQLFCERQSLGAPDLKPTKIINDITGKSTNIIKTA